MAGSVNKVILVGNLGKDPESQSFSNGGKAVKFSLATSENWNDRQSGERREKTEWHNVVIYNDKLGEIAEKYCKKGSKIYLEGSLQTRKWQDNSGQDKYTTEVVLQKFRGELTLLDRAGGGGGGEVGAGGRDYDDRPAPAGRGASGFGQSSGGAGGSSRGGFADDLDDDVPF